MFAKKMMWIAWPAFMMAGVLEMVVFAVVNPQDLHWYGQPLGLSSEWIYTAAFFVFWVIAMASSALTTLLTMSPFEANHCPVSPNDRPNGCAK